MEVQGSPEAPKAIRNWYYFYTLFYYFCFEVDIHRYANFFFECFAPHSSAPSTTENTNERIMDLRSKISSRGLTKYIKNGQVTTSWLPGVRHFESRSVVPALFCAVGIFKVVQQGG